MTLKIQNGDPVDEGKTYCIDETFRTVSGGGSFTCPQRGNDKTSPLKEKCCGIYPERRGYAVTKECCQTRLVAFWLYWNLTVIKRRNGQHLQHCQRWHLRRNSCRKRWWKSTQLRSSSLNKGWKSSPPKTEKNQARYCK